MIILTNNKDTSIFSPTIVVISILRISLLLSRNTVMVIRLLQPVDARTAGERFLHLRLWARSTCEISVAAYWCKVRGTSGKVVIWDRRRRRRDISSAAAIPSTDPTSGHVVGVLVRAGEEGGRVGCHSAVARDDTVLGVRRGLPIDRLHAVFELGRGPEFPFPDDGPDHGDAADSSCNDDKDGDGGVLPGVTRRGRGRRRGSGCGGAGSEDSAASGAV